MHRELMELIKPGRVFLISDDEGENLCVVKIKKCNPIRNWFNVEGDPHNKRRWITKHNWMYLGK